MCANVLKKPSEHGDFAGKASTDRIVTIHQPDFLPWLGFFDRWAKSDIFIVLDDVQFIRKGWHHRDKIKTASGAKWLTVPVIKKGRYEQLIKDVEIDNGSDWRSQHLKTIEHNYGRAPNFDSCFKKISAIYDKKHSLLMDLNMELLSFASLEIGIRAPFVFSSRKHLASKSTAKLVDLVKAVGGSAYLTGQGAKDYLDESIFRREDIKVIWQDYKQPVYVQLHGAFIAGLSVLDYIMMRSAADGEAD